MTPDERTELLNDLSAIAYTHIRFSGLYRELSEEEWEEMAREYGEKVVGLLEQLVNAKFTELEARQREHLKLKTTCDPFYQCECGRLTRL